MKTITIWTQKGGVGKTALACQLAHYAHAKRGQRVVLIDYDSQGNGAAALRRAEKAVALTADTASLLMNSDPDLGACDAPFAVTKATPVLDKVPELTAETNQFHANLRANLTRLAPHFDLCLIDCPPSADTRVMLALWVSDFVLSPIQLNQEAIEGLANTVTGPRGILRFQKMLNPNLRFLGVLLNMVEATPLQKQNYDELIRSGFGRYLVADADGRPCRVLKRMSIAEAQALGLPLWELGRQKTAAREAWAEMEPVFERVMELVGIESAEVAHGA
ncbi:hypothetical protein WK76_24945 [Burkholderia ubonensis]|uniref:ParA family protein n=1 Tax=Burkholderia ubonensis TaxID=101571 RepID=UPI000755B71B|nr:ParA family protein [Burkholderia ubonensis]KVU84277.1 hypothetical protein WK76_24945 [Burkholderia ubonensis]